MGEFVILIVVAGLAWFWVDTLRAREAAIKYSARECDRYAYQLLDQSVGLRKIRLQRNSRGQVQLRREYTLFYSNVGDDRHSAHIVMLGMHVLKFEFAHAPQSIVRQPPEV